MGERAAKLFQSVIWPAAAGNVAWSFFTVAIERGVNQESAIKLIVLSLLAVYLCADWLQTDFLSGTRNLKPCFWLAEGPLAITIVIFAIATQLKKLPDEHVWLAWYLTAVFLS